MAAEPGPMRLALTDAPPAADVDLVRDGLNAANARFAANDADREVAVFLQDDVGRTRGGLVAATFWGWLHVDLLWVEEGLRGEGWGSRLLAAAEAEALARGCRAAILSTLSFQAPDFYRRHGYVVAGEIPDMPPGHRRLYMTKMLGGADGDER